MSQPLLSLSALVAGWEQPASRPLSLSLAAGEILGLAGANGAGKSTVLAALAGRARIFSGEFSRHGRLAWQTQDIPPVAGLPLNGHELLALTGASRSGLPDWLDDKLGWRLDRLSGGQRHYLALWAVLQSPAEIVLLDEPTNHLDAPGCAHLSSALQHRANTGAGLLIVSHDSDFLHATCQRVIVLEAP